MPCEKCRVHLSAYLETHKLTADIREELRKLHNSVNERNGSPQFTSEQLSVYKTKTREEMLLDIKELLHDINAALLSTYHVTRVSSIYLEWKTCVNCIMRYT